MNPSSIFGSAVMMLALATPAAAQARFEGDYTLTFFSGPEHTALATQCINFVFTGHILGFQNSGTWTSSTYSPWGGKYVVDGEVLRWFGVALHPTSITNFYNPITDGVPGTGGYDQWKKKSEGKVVALTDGITTLEPGCGTPHRTRRDGPAARDSTP